MSAMRNFTNCLMRTCWPCEARRAFDFGRPTRYEVFGITVASLFVSLFFWGVAFLAFQTPQP